MHDSRHFYRCVDHLPGSSIGLQPVDCMAYSIGHAIDERADSLRSQYRLNSSAARLPVGRVRENAVAEDSSQRLPEHARSFIVGRIVLQHVLHVVRMGDQVRSKQSEIELYDLASSFFTDFL
jgi:hypothetical protein